MKVTTETAGTREVVLTIEPDERVVQRALRQAARRISKWRPVAGYRPGRAPYSMIERLYGHETILNEALNDIAQRVYRDAIKEAEIEPYNQGQMDVESEDPLVLKATVPLVPVVDLGDYQSLAIEPEPDVAISEEQIDEQIELTRRRNAEIEPVERPAQMGDQVLANIQGVSEGEEVIDREGVSLDLTDELPPAGFAEALVGMSAEETREFSLTYPEDYGDENLAGKIVDFTVEVTVVRQVILPPVDDDLAKTAGDYDTVEEMREGLAAQLQARLEALARNREADRAIETLVELATVDYPAAALDDEIDNDLQSQRARVEQLGFTYENYLRMMGRTEADLREEMRPQAEETLVRRLVLTEFARAEEIQVSETEVGDELASMAALYGSRAEEFMQQFREGSAILSLYSSLLARKAVTALTDMLTGRSAEEGDVVEEDAAEEGDAAEEPDSPEEASADEGSSDPLAAEASSDEAISEDES